ANIKITQVNFEFLEVEIDFTEVENIDPKEITNITKIGAQHSIKDLFNYIISYLEQIKILTYTDSFIHLRILGDS
ncbi:5450_t:CDS:1, partial [Cetraspora pellucida]